MGKPEEEQQPLPPVLASEDPPQNAVAECRCRCSVVRKLIGLRCILVLLLSLAVFLSAVFWLPPFLRLADQKNLHADSRYKDHDIVASFILNKSVSLLEDNIMQLTNEIFDEIEAPSIKVVILSLDPIRPSNMTNVVFAVDPDGKYSEMSSAAISLIKASFQYLVINQSALHLTSSSLFGDPSFFEVLKFKGGITIIPQHQSAFPLQTVQTKFNFTLNFSIDKIQSNLNELTSQLKSGLHLAPFENLHVSLSNFEGSTVAAPTIVQSSVLLAIGISPSKERLKKLAQTIMGPHNLGLNNTQFGRVKQVRLSSILQHSLHGNDGSAWSPSPAPLPRPHHHHHHHQHRHHHHHHNAHLTPAASPTPAPAPATVEGATSPKVGSPAAAKSVPAPWKNSQAQPPNCQSGYRKRSTHNAGKHAHLTPAVAPSIAPHYPVPVASPKSQVEPPTHVYHSAPYPVPVASPKPQVEPPAHVFHSVPALSPLPNVAFAHAEPPPKNEAAGERSPTHFHEPSLSSSSAGCLGTVKWVSVMFAVLLLHV